LEFRFQGGLITPVFIMRAAMLAAFFDELVKIGAAGPMKSSFGKDSGDSEQATGAITNTPAKPGEVKQPITPTQMKPKVISSPLGRGTNYTRSNVEAPGADVTLTQRPKNAPPPPVRV
jgi:hypothetical protein